jgi:hypothetical protein
VRQPTQTPVEPPSGEIQAAPAADGPHADGPSREAEDLGLPLPHRGRVMAAHLVRLTDDPEMLELILAGLLNLP